MKKFDFMKMVCVAATFVFSTSLATAQEAKENPKAPEIQFEKTEHDYGTIMQGDNGECEFVFKNVGKEPLILSNATSTCGCTVPDWPKEPIMPGKKSVIKVRYSTNRLGTINKAVTVTSNAKTNRVVLQLRGNVLQKPVETTPETQQSPVENKAQQTPAPF